MAYRDKEKAKEYYKRWRESERGKEYTKKYMREYYLKNKSPEKKRAAHIKQHFGLSMEDYARLLVSQDYVCGICGGKDSKRPLVVDHDHPTGRVRGLLCSNCNSGMGLLGDDITRLKSAIKWIQASTQRQGK